MKLIMMMFNARVHDNKNQIERNNIKRRPEKDINLNDNNIFNTKDCHKM